MDMSITGLIIHLMIFTVCIISGKLINPQIPNNQIADDSTYLIVYKLLSLLFLGNLFILSGDIGFNIIKIFMDWHFDMTQNFTEQDIKAGIIITVLLYFLVVGTLMLLSYILTFKFFRKELLK